MTNEEQQIQLATDALRATIAKLQAEGVPSAAIKLAMAEYRGLGMQGDGK